MEFSSGEFASGVPESASGVPRSQTPTDSVIAVSTVFPLLVCFFVVSLFVRRRRRRTKNRVYSATDANVVTENIGSNMTPPTITVVSEEIELVV